MSSRRSSRAQALENDRLRTAMQVMETFDSMNARSQQLEMQRGEMEARRRIEERNAAILEKQARKVELDLWSETRSAQDSSHLMKVLTEVDPDDVDAFNVLSAARAGFVYAGEQEKRTVDARLAEAAARKREFDTLRETHGIDPTEFTVEVDLPSGRKTRRVDRVALGLAKDAAERDVVNFRNKVLTSFQDQERFGALLTKGLPPQVARQTMERHLQAEAVFKQAAELGVPSEWIEAAKKQARVQILTQDGHLPKDTTGNTTGFESSANVFIYDDLDKALALPGVEGGRSLRDEINARVSTVNAATEAAAIGDQRSKQAATILEAVKLLPDDGPNGVRAKAITALAQTLGTSAIESMEAGEAQRNPASPTAEKLTTNRQASAAAAAGVLESLQPEDTPSKDPVNDAANKYLGGP